MMIHKVPVFTVRQGHRLTWAVNSWRIRPGRASRPGNLIESWIHAWPVGEPSQRMHLPLGLDEHYGIVRRAHKLVAWPIGGALDVLAVMPTDLRQVCLNVIQSIDWMTPPTTEQVTMVENVVGAAYDEALHRRFP